MARAGSGDESIEPLQSLAGYRKRRLKPGSVCPVLEGLVERCELPQGVRGGTPAQNEFRHPHEADDCKDSQSL